ncbi:MAG: hypothetical protein ACREVL_12625 [Solimonas sp.]
MTMIDGMRIFTALWIVSQCILFGFYLHGARRHRHPCFTVLMLAVVLAVVSMAMMAASYFVPLEGEMAIKLYGWGLLLSFPGLFVGMWGMIWLLRSYRPAALASDK